MRGVLSAVEGSGGVVVIWDRELREWGEFR